MISLCLNNVKSGRDSLERHDMEDRKLNEFIGRAKKVTTVSGWLILKQELASAGATPAEVLKVQGSLQRSDSLRVKVNNPVRAHEKVVQSDRCFIFDYAGSDNKGCRYNPDTRTIEFNKNVLV